ncbi:hypothetical protein [Paraburkholderia humisilvae]|uniref:DUF4942 domain-containing protein n=1 Tax=Paraburkholderia humisilvae TaxID=627669 RepID=A0A6J5DN96_9BURK|nr:hypothetical protein [Paraburkholderia humisilvae]CAB3754662.1 hypothetical protein LMG29542_02415 [Paraburkholderia humisilvae]
METRDLVAATQKLWEDVCNAITVYAAENARLREAEQELYGCESYMVSLSQYPDYKQEDHLKRVAHGLMKQLINAAVREFSPSSAAPIRVDEGAIAEAAGCEGNAFRKFNALTVWKCLESRFGGDQGAETAYRQAAKAIIDQFRIKPEAGIARRKGCIVLDLPLYAANTKWDKTYRLQYSSQEALGSTVLALKSFASWAEMMTLQLGLDGLLRAFRYGDSRVESRQCFTYGNPEDGQVKVTTFYSRFEFVFDAKVSEKLHLFLGEYGFNELAEAA